MVMKSRDVFPRVARGCAISAVALSLALAVPSASWAQAISLAIPAQPLSRALLEFSNATGTQIFFDQATVAGREASGLSGSYSRAEALDGLLAGTGLSYRDDGSTITIFDPASAPIADDGSIVLEEVNVTGVASSTGVSWDGSPETVYTTPGSVAAVSAETIERYRGSSPADILKTLPGVLSGESRNSGGLDPNIRGMQGQGRVAVTVDGASNNMQVYRGYQGVSNRSFIDPDFIAGVSVEKGPSVGNSGVGAIGGTVSMRTVSADDLIEEDEGFVIKVKREFSDNSTDVLTQTTGQKREGMNDGWGTNLDLGAPGLLDSNAGTLSVLAAAKSEAFDLVLGYARRQSGNYHAGTTGDGAAEDQGPTAMCYNDWVDLDEDPWGYWVYRCDGPTREHYFEGDSLTSYMPGEEVLNTSSSSQSLLAKGTFKFAPGKEWELAYSNYSSLYGETYPAGAIYTDAWIIQRELSRSEVNRYTSRLKWDEGDLVNLRFNAWRTELDETSTIIDGSRNSKWAKSWGTDVQNTSVFGDVLDGLTLSYGAAYQFESTAPETAGSPYGRSGEREETSGFVAAKLDVNDWLQLNGGLRYHEYAVANTITGTAVPGDSGGALDYNAGVTVSPLDGLQLFATYKEASRMPSMFEAVGGMFTVPDADLGPERAHNWEFGANYTRDGLLFDDDRLGLKLAYFDNHTTDYIYRRYDSSISGMRIGNIAGATFRGLEGQASYSVGDFEAALNATYYTDVQFCRTSSTCLDTSLGADYATNQIPPEYTLGLTLSQKLLDDRLTLGGRITHVGPRAVGHETPGGGAAPFIQLIDWKPYTLIDVFADYQLTDTTKLSLSIENLTDVYYVDPLSLALIPSPGRTVKLGVTGEFGSATGHVYTPGVDYDWSGAYVGLHGTTSAVFNQADAYTRQTDWRGNTSTRSYEMDTFHSSGAGLQAGYDYAFDNGVVVGLEGTATALRGSVTTGGTDAGDVFTVTPNWLATGKARFGLASGQLLAYASAGLAMGEVEIGLSNASGTVADTKVQNGFTVGGGVEFAFTEQLSVRGEYNFVQLSADDYDLNQLGASAVMDNTTRIDQVTVGVNFRF